MKYSLTIVFFLFTAFQSSAQKRFVNSKGSKIRINTIGVENRKKGQPLLVFESGHGTPMDNWDRVIADSTALGPLVTYDRPGVGFHAQTPLIKKGFTDNIAICLSKLHEM